MSTKTRLVIMIFCVIVSKSLPEPGYAQINDLTITASDGAGPNSFGGFVAISEEIAVVGAASDSDNEFQAGSVYIFKRTGTSWAEETELHASDGASEDHFGISVAISGDYVVVGASGDDDNGLRSGSAYVFKRTGTSWTQETILLASDGDGTDAFGISASLSGDYAVLGASHNDESGKDVGAAYVFKRSGTSWMEEAKILSSDGAESDLFGYSVSVSDDYAIAGAPYHTGNARRSGAAYVFKRDGTSWTQEAKLLASDGAALDWFGISVSISGDYTIVGAQFNNGNGSGSGSAYVYSGFAPTVGVESERISLPAEFALSQNYPNPFNPVTVIEYSLPASGEVSLIVYNLSGQEVARLINGSMPAGNHLITWDASSLASGVYLYRLQAGDFVRTRKMLLLK